MKPRVVSAVAVNGLPVEVPLEFSSSLRRADDHIRLAVAVAGKVFANSGVGEIKDENAGVFVGSAFGPMQTNFEVLGMIADENQTSPTLFTHSVFNSAAGYLSRFYNLSGCTYSLTDFSWPFFMALAEGWRALETGLLENCLVVQVESYSDLINEARERTGDRSVWPPGAVAWFLSRQEGPQGWLLEQLQVEALPASSPSCLHRGEELFWGGEKVVCTTPLAAAANVTELLRDGVGGSVLQCSLRAPYGSVSLTFRSVEEMVCRGEIP